ncbi:MAG: hypothetical protein MUF48_22580 [Pirellulaceae bacterium]|jgi:protein tyrosine phosphatase (PTP) superfamily phosphohydrolase (DUF442 family)|nr:hypothetical protein [Pirellulaceae bacterium]
MRHTSISLVVVLFLTSAGGCVRSTDDPTASAEAHRVPPNNESSPSETEGLHNVMEVSHGIYSGSEPLGEEGFASLQQLGFNTIISVDGARPDVERARTYGLRYIHIPVGYDGISHESGQLLARATKEADGPIYIHCHHGKHRGPAAAAVACIAAGRMTAREALGILERAGTSKDYAGLWRDVANYAPPAADAELPELVEVAQVDSLAAAMAQLDRSWDHLKRCREANWSAPVEHPDLVPSQEALLIEEALREAGRNLGSECGEQFRQWLTAAQEAARQLRVRLNTADRAGATEQFLRLEQSCPQCHHTYRDR